MHTSTVGDISFIMTVPKFDTALRQMLSKNGSPVVWSADGLKIRVVSQFEPCMFMTCTVSRKYSTFVRQLNNHGFRSNGLNVWSHEEFARDRPDRDHLIVPLRRRVRFAESANSNVC